MAEKRTKRKIGLINAQGQFAVASKIDPAL
jgi:hypothetical protein